MPVPKRVLLLQTRFIAGISDLNGALALSLTRQGIDVTCVYLESGKDCSGATRTQSLHLSKTDYAGLRLGAKKQLKAFFLAYSFDVIIVNMYKPIELLCKVEKYLGNAKCIGVFHAFGEFDRLSRRLAFRYSVKKRFQFVGVSQALCDYLIAQNVGISSRNCHCIYNAIDLTELDKNTLARETARELFGISPSHKVIGTLGRLVADKQQHVLISAMARLIPRLPDLKLVIMGDGELLKDLQRQARELGISDHVIFSGAIEHGSRYLPALDVFAFPSRSEGFGLALLEAMAQRVPVLINNIEPLSTIMGGIGEGINVNNPRELDTALFSLLTENTNAARQQGEALRQRVENEFSLERFETDYYRLLTL